MIQVRDDNISTYAEDEKRHFIVKCRKGIMNTERCFKYRSSLRKFVEQPPVTNIRISVTENGDE